MYIMCVCLFSALSRRVGALQISIIIIMNELLTCDFLFQFQSSKTSLLVFIFEFAQKVEKKILPYALDVKVLCTCFKAVVKMNHCIYCYLMLCINYYITETKRMKFL